MAINLKLSSSASGTRNLGPVNMGGGSNLIQRSLFSTSTPALAYSSWYTPGAGSPAVSTADYYHMNGVWWSQPYDLDTMSTHGATIKAREGFRYVWMMGCDHPATSNFQGSGDFYVGYSNDPQVWPDPTTLRMLRRQEDSISVVDQLGYTQNQYFVYHAPRLVYNPDSGGDKFYIYAEAQSLSSSRQHELGLFTTSDFLTTTLLGPAIPTGPGAFAFNGWTSLGYVERIGTGNWIAYTLGKADVSSTGLDYYKYTSTDGWSWTPDYSHLLTGPGPYLTISGQTYLLWREQSTNDYLSLLAVDANKVSLGTYTRISTAFGPSTGSSGVYPGPTWMQGFPSAYVEDGVASVYVTRGYFVGGASFSLNTGPYLDISPGYFDITGSITSNVLTVTAVPPGSTLAVNQQLVAGPSGQTKITSFGTGTGGTGTYNVSATSNLASTTITMSANGGLWQDFIDQYSIVTDATAAAGAAPLGVVADCVSGVVTVSWNDCLPNRTYRVYKGSSSGTQATLVGDVTGVSITDSPTAGQQWWYKVVTMLSGVEQKNRVVNVYVSNNTLMVTRHVNRVINDGGDATKIDMTFLASIDSYLTSNDYYKYLMWWVDARFGVKFDGSGFVSKVYCLGTTRLPRGGDFTPTTSNTFPSTSSNSSYSATSFRGTTPSWINNATSAHGYFGNGRANNIQRKNEITLIAAYQKPNTNLATLFGMGQFASGMYLQQASGSSGNISFVMYSSNDPPAASSVTANVAFASATTAKVVAGVFDGVNMTAYLDGVAGTPVDATSLANPIMANDSVLRGKFGSTNSSAVALVSGSQTGLQTLLTRAYTMDNQGQFTDAARIVFEKGMPSSAITAITALYA